MKTRDLTGAALDWAVAKAAGIEILAADRLRVSVPHPDGGSRLFLPSIRWDDAGPLIDQYGISIIRCDDDRGRDAKGFTTSERIPVWAADVGQQSAMDIYGPQSDNWGNAYSIDVEDVFYGPTPLVAAMRAFVASKLGLIITNLPEGLK